MRHGLNRHDGKRKKIAGNLAMNGVSLPIERILSGLSGIE
jgi:hypothetical protein